MMELGAQELAELRAALLSVECPPDSPEEAHVALTLLRAMYAELVDMALYCHEHREGSADCDMPSYADWQEERDRRLLGEPQILLNSSDDEPALD
jgi:hypothetical protein